MALSLSRLAEIADYCKVDVDDPQLVGFVAVAEAYLTGGVCAEPADGSALAEAYIQCVKYLTLDMYDRRDMSIEGSVSENPGFARLKNQLKMTNPTALSDLS